MIPYRESNDNYKICIVEDGIEIYNGKEREGKTHLEIGTVFSYIYIEWDFIERVDPPPEYTPIYNN